MSPCLRKHYPLAAAGLLFLAFWGAGPLSAQQSIFPVGSEKQNETSAPSGVADAATLQPGWWQALTDGEGDLAGEIDATLAQAAERVAQLPGDRLADGEQILSRLRSNLRGYQRLNGRAAAEAPKAATFKDAYPLDEVVQLDRALREARVRLDGDLAEFESRKRTVTNLTRQTESRFAAYLETTERTAERVLGGLEVMALRAGTLLEQEQVRLLSARVDALRARVAQLEEELTVARQRVSLDDLSEEKLDRALQQAGKELDADRRRLRKAEADLIDVVAEAEADSLAIAVARQEITAKSVEEARAELEVAAIEVKRDILLLRTREAELSLDPLQTRVSQRQELMERINSRMRGWSETGEQGLAESASAMAGEAERELIEKRALVAARLLSDLQALRRSLGDLVLLQDMAIESLRARQGRLQGTLSNLASQFANGWDTLKRIATASIVTIGDTPVTIAGLFRVLVILTAAFWLSRILRHALDRMGASKRTSMSQSSLYSLGRLLHYVIIFAGIIIGLSSIGLDFTNLALVAGALGVGIGFGLQSVVSNFVSGLILLFERSLNVGDFVELDSGVTGVIREINVRSTLLNTNDNVDILVPNSEFVNGKLINWTLREAIKRIHVPFGVAYGTDKELTKKAVLEAAQRVPLTYTGPGRNPQVWLVGFGDSSLDYELVVWLGADAVRRPAAVQAAYLWEIETSLGEHGIEIPFPQRDLHLRSSLEVLRGNSDSATNK